MVFKDHKTEAMVQYVLFAILVVMTPFIVVTGYVQGVAHLFSHFSFELFEIEIPYLVLFALLGLSAFLIWQRKKITLRKTAAVFFPIAMIAIAHRTQDIYLNMSFFDLQINWHYIAYCAYVFFFFRAFNARHMPQNRMIITAYFTAILMSMFDETFQYFMSDRIFDISDISKDALGVYTGLIFIFFVTETYGTISIRGKSLIQERVKDYFRKPPAIMLTLGVLTMSFIMVSPLFTEYEYCLWGIFGSIMLFLVIMLVLHFTRFKIFRLVFGVITVSGLILLTVTAIINRDNGIEYKHAGLMTYRGIPIPYFDFIIYPDGYSHLIDKKKYFRSQDKKYMLEQKPDIILIGAGSDGSGGQGFDQVQGTNFIYNQFTLKGAQVIILPAQEACSVFNRLKSEGKSVFFAVHNN